MDGLNTITRRTDGSLSAPPKWTRVMAHFTVHAATTGLLLLSVFGNTAMAASNGVNPAGPQAKKLSVSKMTQGECLNLMLGKIVKNLACDGEQACSYIGDDGKAHLKCVDSLHLPK